MIEGIDGIDVVLAMQRQQDLLLDVEVITALLGCLQEHPEYVDEGGVVTVIANQPHREIEVEGLG